MFKHKYIASRVNRRTYIKGSFKGKYTGKLDPSTSDPRQENFYDLEILEGEITTRQDHLVPWMEHKEPDEFAKATVFPARLQSRIGVTLHYLNGETKHFKIALKEIKLIDCHLSGQIYTHNRNEVFGNITGLVSGYVLHHDMLAGEIIEIPEKSPEPLVANEEAPKINPESTDATEKKQLGRTGIKSENATTITPQPTGQHLYTITGVLLGLGLLVVAFFIAKNWIITLLGVLGTGLLIRLFHGWTNKRFGSKISRTITTLAILAALVCFAFYLTADYQDNAQQGQKFNVTDLKNEATKLFSQGNYEKAFEIYNRLLELDKDDPGLLYKRAFCYIRLGKVAEAVADLRLLVAKGDTTAISLHDSINPLIKRQIGTQIRCNDGYISKSKNRRGTCSKHGGVKDWEEPVYEEYRQYE